MVSVVYRHGGRAPLKFFPTVKHYEEQFPNGAGWLTTKGMKIEYDLGVFLRKRYIVEKKFLDEKYNHNHVRVYSSGRDRCLQSAELQLAGLFPPKGDQVWNKHLLWQPIPIHSSPIKEDALMMAYECNCPKRDAITKARKNAPIYKKKSAESAKLLKTLTKHAGMNVTMQNVWRVKDVITSLHFEGIQTPNWLTTSLCNEISDLDDWQISYEFYGNDEISRLYGGPLLRKFRNNMKHKAKENSYKLPTFKMQIYSGHDFTLLGLASALDIKIDKPINFASCIMAELYRVESGEYEVEMYYRNEDTASKPKQLKLKNCSVRCPLKKFLELTEKRSSKDRTKECQV